MQVPIKTQISDKEIQQIDLICRRRSPKLSRWAFLQEAVREKIALEKEINRNDPRSKTRTYPNPTTH